MVFRCRKWFFEFDCLVGGVFLVKSVVEVKREMDDVNSYYYSKRYCKRNFWIYLISVVE